MKGGAEGSAASDARGTVDRIEETVVTIVFVGAAGWLVLLLMCAYSKARDPRN